MSHQVPVNDAALADTNDEDGVHEVLPDTAYKRLLIVPVVLFGQRRQGVRDVWQAGRGSRGASTTQDLDA